MKNLIRMVSFVLVWCVTLTSADGVVFSSECRSRPVLISPIRYEPGQEALSCAAGWGGTHRLLSHEPFLSRLLLRKHPVQKHPADADYSATVVSSTEELIVLAESAAEFFRDFPVMLRPAYFVLSINPRKWKPSVVVVRWRGEIVGVVYAKERKVLGLPIGFFEMGRTAIVNQTLASHPAHRESVFRMALYTWFKAWKNRAWRFILAPDGNEIVITRALASAFNLDIVIKQEAAERHDLFDATLPLPSTFGEFLKSMSPGRRRNWRRDSRGDQTYRSAMSIAEFREAAATLRGKSKRQFERKAAEIDRLLAMYELTKEPLRVGLWDANGFWIALAIGWIQDDSVYVEHQINNHTIEGSANMLLRFCMAEYFIKKGLRRLVFPGGLAGHLRHYAQIHPYAYVYLDRSTLPSRLSRYLFARMKPYLPEKLKASVDRNVLDARSANRTHGSA